MNSAGYGISALRDTTSTLDDSESGQYDDDQQHRNDVADQVIPDLKPEMVFECKRLVADLSRNFPGDEQAQAQRRQRL